MGLDLITSKIHIYFNVCQNEKMVQGSRNNHVRASILHRTFIFGNESFPTTAVQQKQHADAVGCRKSFSVLSVCLFLISCKSLEGELASTCTPLATGA